MDPILRRLSESRRLDEVSKKKALNKLAADLEQDLSGKVDKKSHHKISITPNYEEGCVDIVFKGTTDAFSVHPKKEKISNENSNKVVKVDSIDGAYIEGTQVYNSDGELIGDALVRRKAIHSKSNYSDSLEDAEYRFNSRITDYRRLEKYVASEAINNMK